MILADLAHVSTRIRIDATSSQIVQESGVPLPQRRLLFFVAKKSNQKKHPERHLALCS